MRRTSKILLGCGVWPLLAVLLLSSLVLAASPMFRMRVGYTSVGGNRAPLWIARDENIFSKYGLEVDLVYIPGAATAVPALLSKDLDILAGSAATTLQAMSQGAKLVMFGTFGPTPYILFTRPEIKTPAQLKGATIGINRIGSSDYYALRRALQKLSLAPDRDVKIVTSGDAIVRWSALDKGLIQGTLTSESTMLRRPIQANPLVELIKLGIEDHGSALVTTREFMTTQTQIVDRFVRAFVEAIALGRTNGQLSKRVFARNLRESNESYLDFLHRVYVLGSIPRVPVYPPDALKNFISDLGEDAPKVKALSVTDILDNSLIRRLEDERFIDRLYAQKREGS
jgi:ABC-type nitrate/sulfonate/bicarbonate transport system substrate-binding protein